VNIINESKAENILVNRKVHHRIQINIYKHVLVDNTPYAPILLIFRKRKIIVMAKKMPSKINKT